MDDDNVPTSAGLSSFNLINERTFLEAVGIRDGMTVFDLGCGVGNYAVAISPHLGKHGMIIAMDPWHEGVETLEVRAQVNKLPNIFTLVADAGQGIPLGKESIDCCLLATVTHILLRGNNLAQVLLQLRDILRPDGILAIVEFHKIDGPPGPPLEWRISSSELENIVGQHGYLMMKSLPVGPYNYLSLFRKNY